MRVRLTESQYNKIRLIKESEEAINKYNTLCIESIKEVESIYLKAVNSTVMEILSGQINCRELRKKIDKIETNIYNAEKTLISMYDSGDDEQYDTISKIEDTASAVTDRITSLSLILDIMEELQNKQEEFNLTNNFKSVKPIEIQSF